MHHLPETLLIVKNIEDSRGAFVQLLEALEDANLSVRAVSGARGGDVVLLVEDVPEAFTALRTAGFEVEQQKALVLMAGDTPNELRRLLKDVADAGVDVSTLITTREGRVVVAVSDYETAVRAVGGAAVVT